MDQATYEACKAALQPFLDKLHDLNSRLDIGLTQGDYNTELGDIKVVYDKAVP